MTPPCYPIAGSIYHVINSLIHTWIILHNSERNNIQLEKFVILTVCVLDHADYPV